MRHYWPSLLIIKGRSFRFPRKLSEAERITILQQAHRLADAQREIDKLQRVYGGWLEQFYWVEADRYRVHDLAERYRLVEAQTQLNAAKIALLEAHEDPLMNREKKEKQTELVNWVAEEAHELRDEQRIQDARINRLGARVTNLERALGEDTDV